MDEQTPGEYVRKNAFYMPVGKESADLYKGYTAKDLFGLEIDKIVPLDKSLDGAFDW